MNPIVINPKPYHNNYNKLYKMINNKIMMQKNPNKIKKKNKRIKIKIKTNNNSYNNNNHKMKNNLIIPKLSNGNQKMSQMKIFNKLIKL